MVGVIWYRFVRCGGTDWSDTLVPIRPLQWYRLKRYVGTDSSATVVPIRRYYHNMRQVQICMCLPPNRTFTKNLCRIGFTTLVR